MRVGIAAAILGVLGTSSPVHARTFLLLDADDTIFESRIERGGVFSTPIRVFRVDERTNTLQPIARGPETVDLSAQDYERLQFLLTREDGIPGSQQSFKLESGATIIPAEYRLIAPQSYIFFNEGMDGTNHLLARFKLAEKQASAEEGKTFKGPLWDLMISCLNDADCAPGFGVVTARGHSRAEWAEFFQYLKDHGYIKYLPDERLIHNVARPEYDRFGRSITSRKLGLVSEYATLLERSPYSANDLRLNATGDSTALSHYLVYGDDHTDIVEGMTERFRSLAMARRGPYTVKFGIVLGGNAKEVRDTGRPQFAIVQPSGTFRGAELSEMFGFKQRSCAGAMKGGQP